MKKEYMLQYHDVTYSDNSHNVLLKQWIIEDVNKLNHTELCEAYKYIGDILKRGKTV